MSEHENEDAVNDPAAMWGVLNQQRRRTARYENRTYVVMLITWALSWAVGFTALWSAQSTGGNPGFRLPDVAAWAIFIALLAVGIVVSIVAGIRSSPGVRGPSRLTGALYGWSWTITMVAAGTLLGAFRRAGMSDELANVLSPALFILLVGTLYLAGGALWRAPLLYALGVIMIATVVAASYVGAPTHYLIYATVGPVAMLIVAVIFARGTLSRERVDR